MRERLDDIIRDAVEADDLSEDERDKARAVFVSLMWRALLRSTPAPLTAAQLECAEHTIQEWADAALGEAKRWTLH